VGVMSHSDVRQIAAENKCPAWMKARIFMTRELVTVTPEMTLRMPTFDGKKIENTNFSPYRT